MLSTNLLEINNLSVRFEDIEGIVEVLEDVNMQIKPSQWTGLVGETGCGKTVTALSIIGLLHPAATITSGSILFKGKNLLEESKKNMQKIRGSQISMIFQDPTVAMNPAFKIGYQIRETVRLRQKISNREANQNAIKLLGEVGLQQHCLDLYPHELSGGMLQRVMIALALCCNPSLILADEPTSSLDVTTQKEILTLMRELGSVYRTSILLITHDLLLVSEYCQSVIVMYMGEVVERGPFHSVLARSFHPYTKALVRAIPTIDTRKEFLEEIEGSVPDSLQRPSGCPFWPRCVDKINGLCEIEKPEEKKIDSEHLVKCHLANSRQFHLNQDHRV